MPSRQRNSDILCKCVMFTDVTIYCSKVDTSRGPRRIDRDFVLCYQITLCMYKFKFTQLPLTSSVTSCEHE